jgi:hypothetical protein
LQPQKEESKPAEDEGEFPTGGVGVIILEPGEVYDPAVHSQSAGGEVVILPSKVVILPTNGREGIVAERQRQRLERLAELAIEDDDEPAIVVERTVTTPPPPAAPVRRISRGKALLREIRARRRAARAA